MKTYLQTLKKTAGWSLALAVVLGWAQFRVLGADGSTGEASAGAVIVSDGTNVNLAVPAVRPPRPPRAPPVIRSIETARIGERLESKEVPWLGAAIEEAPEVLTAQLGLAPGVGLVVSYVATNSPAAKAGLEKNDVLVEFEGQSLVHPLQLRKLVQVRKEGDTVKLVFYRAGKKQTVTATLGKTSVGFGAFGDAMIGEPFSRMNGTFPGAALNDAQDLKRLSEEQVLLQQSQQKAQDQIRQSFDKSRRSFDEARRAYEQALRSETNMNAEVDSLRKTLQDLARAEVFLDDKATVTVRSTGVRTKNIVHADDSGTIVILSKPKLHLTAHDKDGKLTYDGEIEIREQRDQVPPELWKKVEPLLDQLNLKAKEAPKTEPSSL